MIRPKIPFAPSVSKQYDYVSLLCGRGCVISITSYVDYFTRVKSSETNDKTLPCGDTWSDSVSNIWHK